MAAYFIRVKAENEIPRVWHEKDVLRAGDRMYSKWEKCQSLWTREL